MTEPTPIFREGPPLSDWYCDGFNDFTKHADGNYLTLMLRPVAGKEPHPIHRFLQELLLGCKWRSYSKDFGE